VNWKRLQHMLLSTSISEIGRGEEAIAVEREHVQTVLGKINVIAWGGSLGP
jgi:hypothetical protein